MAEVDPNEDTEELEELPPLDPSSDEEHEGPDDSELTPLLTPLEEDVDLDEERAVPDVDLGLEVPDEPPDRDEGHEVVLDIQSLLSLADEDDHDQDADRSGPEQLDPAADISDVDEPIVGSLEEGTDEPLEDLVSDDLPELDADEPGGLDNDASWLSSDALRDEDLPEASERPWRVARVDAALTELEALALGGGRLWVGGHELWSFERDGSARRSELGVHVLGLTALGTGVVALTPAGLLEAVTPGSEARRLGGFREALGLASDAPAPLTIGRLGEAESNALLVAADESRIAVSRNGGASFEGAEVGGRIVAVSRGAPTRLVVQGAEGPALLELDAQGFRRTLLDAEAEEAAGGELALLGSLGEVVAVASRDRGLALSSDAGRSFSRVPGCLHTTALELGTREGRPRVWLAVFVESEERSLVIEVDVATRSAEIVAELTGADDVAPSDDDDGRVCALAWDADHGWLWAAGQSGLFRLDSPASSA